VQRGEQHGGVQDHRAGRRRERPPLVPAGGGGHREQQQRRGEAAGERATGEGQEAGHRGQRDQRREPGDAPGPRVHRPGGAQAEEQRPVQRRQREEREPAEQGVGVEQVEQRRADDAVGPELDAAHDVGEHQAPPERGHGAAGDDRGVPAGAPAPRVDVAPPALRGGSLPRYSNATPRSTRASTIASTGR
jgi:hypothetical protein